jgi:hypothetical protein
MLYLDTMTVCFLFSAYIVIIASHLVFVRVEVLELNSGM